MNSEVVMNAMPPLNADARSSVDIEDSCNCCVGVRRRPRQDPRRPIRAHSAVDFGNATLKVKSVSQPVLSQVGEDEWEIQLDARKVTSEPSLHASSANIDIQGK